MYDKRDMDPAQSPLEPLSEERIVAYLIATHWTSDLDIVVLPWPTVRGQAFVDLISETVRDKYGAALTGDDVGSEPDSEVTALSRQNPGKEIKRIVKEADEHLRSNSDEWWSWILKSQNEWNRNHRSASERILNGIVAETAGVSVAAVKNKRGKLGFSTPLHTRTDLYEPTENG